MNVITIETNIYDRVAYTKRTELYRDIFGAPPWNEGWKSTKTGKVYPLSQIEFGDDTVKPFYDLSVLEKQRRERSQKQGFIESLAITLEGNDLVGFALGRQTNLDQLNQDKFMLSSSEFSILKKQCESQYLDFSDDSMFYCADLGVRKNQRGAGIASKLFREREKRAREMGMKYLIVRTTMASDVPYKWYVETLGFKEVYRYEDLQKRVILLAELN